MPQRKTAMKALRVNRLRRLRNLDIKTDLKKTIKRFKALVNAKNITEAQSTLNTVYKKIDKASKRNILNKKTASRRKSLLARLLGQVKV